jgi:hypothetical protein
MKQYQCERCKKITEMLYLIRYASDNNLYRLGIFKKIELCPECYDQFIKWIIIAEKQPEQFSKKIKNDLLQCSNITLHDFSSINNPKEKCKLCGKTQEEIIKQQSFHENALHFQDAQKSQGDFLHIRESLKPNKINIKTEEYEKY